MKIAVVKEGFGHPQSEADVDALVQKGAASFRELGRQVDEVSIPMHLPGAASGRRSPPRARRADDAGNGFGFNWKGLYVTSLIDAHSAWRQRADELSDTLKTTILFGQYALNKYRGHYYAKAQNLARTLRRRLRRGAGQLRPAADADLAAEGHPDAGAGGAAHGDHPAAPSRCCRTPRPSTSPAIRR